MKMREYHFPNGEMTRQFFYPSDLLKVQEWFRSDRSLKSREGFYEIGSSHSSPLLQWEEYYHRNGFLWRREFFRATNGSLLIRTDYYPDGETMEWYWDANGVLEGIECTPPCLA